MRQSPRNSQSTVPNGIVRHREESRARFLDSLRETHSPAFACELAERHREMDAGRRVSEAELARILAAKPATPRP